MMKRRFQTWLLVLFVAMLPLRGALAAVGMFCHVDPAATNLMATGLPEHDDRGLDHHHIGTEHGSSLHQHGTATDTDAGGDGPAALVAFACSFCASVCGSPPVPAAEVAVPVLLVAGSQSFPALAAPRVHATTGGVERPPRTI